MKKAIALLSGGQDSPVAIDLLKNRLDIIAIHFHQMPLTDEQEIEKVKRLQKQLGVKKLYLIPYADLFKEIVSKCQHRYYFILTKIAMIRAAEMIAEKEAAEFLITGENLSQVSSQTVSNLVSISKPIKLIILRPLLTYDKIEIMRHGEKIGTYEISKGPELCCLLGPKNPATRSDPEKIKKELEKIPLDDLIHKQLAQAEIIFIS
ncbi:MAG TPA: hypothetical protein HA360_06085 [Nanoarchaeota archaeon]|nr:7-cyano-7-deazaguanine synthase [Candidatus Woesearchaeota archaeon]HIH15570.1 hypothetical protein [Nanoarchaeota archaeon]HIH59098.1 hypothetical protein [Nanoarchaeota archaeon]HII14614.1 hypothetical protein [Nanoarchaeota archaeon]HIJ05443.1 hypothetical protein [Nanoarchaeota archaeon]